MLEMYKQVLAGAGLVYFFIWDGDDWIKTVDEITVKIIINISSVTINKNVYEVNQKQDQ